GVDAVGENRVQEMLQKHGQGAYDGAELHFIGHLQTNKARHVVGRVELLQSLDSIRLAEAVDRTAAAMGIRQKALVEVNVGGEPSKSGLGLYDFHKSFSQILELSHICVCGLMAIPPIVDAAGSSRKYYDIMRKLFVDIIPDLSHNTCSPVLSMGMSDDFEEAIEAGATMIRVGTALFGYRR
ncbi:MAG: YggS family pyridoxal phosphate-dependent enzyme, partial [Oscillospiraceae bacterium]|nr:YggS family pyridoxal phosphate-dependent enzyme [Oscillospiraceae bacterium]